MTSSRPPLELAYELDQGNFDIDQINQLLSAIRPGRVMQAQGHSHLPQQDVIAHLIRCFGFGGFTFEILSEELLFEQVRPESQKGSFTKDGNTFEREHNPQVWKYDVAYKVSMRLTVFDKRHRPVAFYEDASTGDAQNQFRADGHDLALKSAISLARKRCCICLGDQFGLSLYNKGQVSALVGGTHNLPDGYKDEMAKRREEAGKDPVVEENTDLQGKAPKPESLGVDETQHDPAEATPEQDAAVGQTLGGKKAGEEPNPDRTKD